MNTAVQITVVEKWQSLANLFAFASRLYLQEPSVALCRDCRQAGHLLLPCLPEEDFPNLLHQIDEHMIDEIRQDFFNLFLVPVSGVYAPPYESVHRLGMLGGEINAQLAEVYQQAGFCVDELDMPGYFKRMGRNDHLGVELAFCANLLYSAARAGGDAVEIESLYDTARNFFRVHLLSWAGDYGKKLHQEASSSMFKALGALTGYLLRDFSE